MVLSENFIFLGDVFLGKGLFKFVSALLQLKNKLIKALINIAGLLLVKSLDFLLDMLNKLPVIIIDALRIQHQLV